MDATRSSPLSFRSARSSRRSSASAKPRRRAPSLRSGSLGLPLLRTLRHEPIGPRVPPRLEAHRRLAPRCLGLAADGGLRLAAAVRVVTRRHDDAAYGGPPAHPPAMPGAPDLAVLVLDVADLPHGRPTPPLDEVNSARRKPDLCVFPFLRHELRRTARRAHELRAPARLELDAVNLRTGRHVLQRQAVAHARLGVRTGEHGVADLELVRGDDVALL